MAETTIKEVEKVITEDSEAEKFTGPDSDPCPVQICSVGTDEDEYAFKFHDERLNGILQQIPPGWKVSVVSVVGTFRTGKSFLLSWFLRYLRHHHDGGNKENVEKDGGDSGKMWYEHFESLGQDAFHWQGGAERHTTGIWMWSHPYFLKRKLSDGSEEDIALILVDTQGMFDNETTMGLTAAIFGLSTLLSSYQIYNVDKRIQEDNLQHLALFSEYGRMALKSHNHPEKKTDSSSSDPASDKEAHGAKTSSEEKKIPKPFQKIEFLVRDWQNFDDEDEIEQCEKEMVEYLDTVLKERTASDLKDTRDQIKSCFDDISCYMFTHPGNKVTNKKYEGSVKQIDETFLTFLNRYCKKVFDGNNLVPKSIHGRELTAAELGAYIKAYASMFESGAHFPEASTMLDATTYANNTNAINLSIKEYKEKMDQLAGPRVDEYTNPEEFKETHLKNLRNSLKTFDSIANFGNTTAIEKAKKKMEKLINDSFELYFKLNESRNPLAGLEIYIIPMTIAALSLILRWIADTTCSSWSQTCRASSDALSHLYQVVIFFLLILAATKAQQIAAILNRIKKAVQAISGDGNSGSGSKKKD